MKISKILTGKGVHISCNLLNGETRELHSNPSSWGYVLASAYILVTRRYHCRSFPRECCIASSALY